MVQQTAYDSFLLLGDSITQGSFDLEYRGFGAQLAQSYQRRLDIVNRGYSGYTSEQGIHLLPQFLPRVEQSTSTAPKIQFLTIFYGANDACLSPSLQHVELERYEQNIRTMIDMVHSPNSPTYSPGTRIILICPGPVEESLWAHRRKGQGRPMDRDKDVTKQYAALCLKVGQEYQAKNAQQASPQHHQVDVIDTWGLITAQVENGQQALTDYLRDGVHFTSEANDLVFKHIMEIIRRRYPEWDPEKMPMHAPLYADLDLAHPETDLLLCANKVN
ncbi:hypothetical protein BGX34_003710 [Mortierella sp. NVP85]|nr:hypothetical protein BGX34_003710 [Mortierella sp. NVP85]